MVLLVSESFDQGVIKVTKFTQDEIKSALARLYRRNGFERGLELNLTYSFASALPHWTNFDFQASGVVRGTVNSITEPQKEAFDAAVKSWESVANIRLFSRRLNRNHSVAAA